MKKNRSLYFMLIIILIYVVLFFINKNLIINSLKFFISLIIKIVPLFLLILILMALLNYFLHRERIERLFVSRKGIRRWAIIVIAGILSSGPVFMWFPLLRNLRKKGVEYGYLACFMYGRSALKIPLLPMFIAYFDIAYIVVMMAVMTIMAVVQGLIINIFFRKFKE